ncbi:F-actin-capping protein subunit alpha [Halteromyces radiatus]|uniref:F-actin-capping protein subunit alpha n=1 Tax=Halteromyces radiatus TaxID=101107 RepID=UPI00222067A6|nr:F-actin-capping protein subunit alpha [Halteromyces radiatus]KAI8086401.1 F-actin-capping protein subunit alpha [Halteromyces radiatus]
MNEITTEKKVEIASDFLLSSPPGEVNDVFNDVRTLVNDDEALQDGILNALEQYNTEQHITVTPPGLDYPVIISKYNKVGDRYLDPRSKKSFTFDHMRLTADNVEPYQTEENTLDSLRTVMDEVSSKYVNDHYPEGVSSVFINEKDIILAIVDNKYNPNNYWNGRWLAVWTYDTETNELKGKTKVNVHYYEDGNVQLNADKQFETSVTKNEVRIQQTIPSFLFIELLLLLGCLYIGSFHRQTYCYF